MFSKILEMISAIPGYSLSSCCLTQNLKKFGKHFSKSTAKIFWHEVLTSCEKYLRTFFYCVYMYVLHECVHKWRQEHFTVCVGFQRTLWIFCLVPLWDLRSKLKLSDLYSKGFEKNTFRSCKVIWESILFNNINFNM